MMTVETMAMIAAGIGVVATLIFMLILAAGVRSLRDIRRLLRGTPGDRR